MNHQKLRASGLVLLALGVARCNNGTETDNPMTADVTFHGSPCNHQGTSQDSGSPPASTALSSRLLGAALPRQEIAGDYTRLHCLAWRREGDALHVSVRNLPAACGIEWAGANVRVNGDSVLLDAYNPECRVARCGTCFYDLEFAVTGAPAGGDLHVALAVTNESGDRCDDAIGTANVSIDESEPSGVRCLEVNPERFQPPPAECTRYAACSEACTCESGTRCSPAGSDFSVAATCVPECTSSGDCPVQGAFDCAQGLCRPKQW